MSRRVSLPSADDLFRPTAEPDSEPTQGLSQVPTQVSGGTQAADREDPVDQGLGAASRKPSGRVRHDEKMTVYVTADELVDIEHARLGLRRSHGLAVDRGRLVREAVAIALADFELNGEDSVLVQRLTQR